MRAHDKNGKNGKMLANDWESYADGRVLSGTQALDLGLVDELGNFDDAVTRTKMLAHIDYANLIEYRERHDFADFISMFSQGSEAHDIRVDLGMEISKLRECSMYFLWETPAN